MCQRARFVEDDRIDFGNRFEEFAPLYRDVIADGFAHRRKDGQRHGEFECT